MYAKDDEGIFCIKDDLKQIFKNKFTINIGQKEIIKMKNSEIITDRDLAIAKFLYKFRFATLNQIYEYLEHETDKEMTSKIGIKNRLEKLVGYRILNKFILSDEISAETPEDALEIYCMDIGGRYLLAHYSNEDTMDWYTIVNMKTSSLVYKDLFITEFYLKLLNTCPQKILYFNLEPNIAVANKNVSPCFDMCINVNGLKNYFVGEIVRTFDIPIYFRDRVFKMESLLQTNAWKKYYYDSQIPPVLLLFADTEETALDASKLLVEATEMNRFRVSTSERIKRVLYSNGAFLKYIPEENELQEIKALTFAP